MKSLPLFACLVFAICTTKTFSLVNKKDTTELGCIIWNNITECNEENGSAVDLTTTSITSINTSCWFQSTELDLPIQKLCQQYGSTFVWKDSSVVLYDRVKKAFGDATALGISSGAEVGAMFGPEGAAIGAAVAGGIGLIADIVCMFTCSDPPPPNKPPSLVCPSIIGSIEKTPEPKQLEAVVSWTKGSANDTEDGTISVQQYPKAYKSGGSFKEGTYVVNFRAADSNGLADQCAISFSVRVHRCNPPNWPYKGYLECNSSYILGNECAIFCNDGYQLSAAQKKPIACTKGGWSRQIQDCEPMPCKKSNGIRNGVLYCPNNKAVYGTACTVECDEGFRRVGSPFMSCDKNGDWDIPPTCKDHTGPVIRPGTCPNDMQVDIDSSNNTAKVNWIIPLGDDNSGEAPVIIETHGYTPGQRFAAGTHRVEYALEDSDHNQGNPCTFFIEVQTISCQPPSLNVEGGIYMLYDCPHLHRLGGECNLKCRSGYPMVGVDQIQCANDGSNPPNLQWTWDQNGLSPYCKISNCPDLKAPSNGALACNLWDHGSMCQLQCQEGFDVPLIRDGMYVCGTSDGKWRPDSNVPDCNPKRNAHQMHLKSDLYYFTGKCNSSAQNLMEIKNNFVQALNSSKYHENCVGISKCKAEFVNVTCGPTTTRRRRDIDQVAREKRNAGRLAYTVTFDLTVPFVTSNTKTNNELFVENDDILNDMIDQIQTEVDSGHFNMPNADMKIEPDSLGIGSSEFTCQKGTMPNQQSATCSGCPSGRFFSEQTGDCQYCPIGTFQDEPNSLDCKTCPFNTNTTTDGANTKNDCLEYCKPGYFSITGLSPCSACDSTSYQPNNKATRCIHCGSGKRTKSTAATSQLECQDYDIRLDENSGVQLRSSFVSPALTLSTWIHVPQTKGDLSIIHIKSASHPYNFSVVHSKTLSIESESNSYDTGKTLQSLKWYHVAVSVDAGAKTLHGYLNGKEVYSNAALISSRPNIIEVNDSIALIGDMQLSSFKLMNRSASNTEIATWANECNQTLSEAVISTDSIARFQSANVIIPSMCDALDECESSPCSNHTCINKKGSFKCECREGYSGKQCEIKPDFCENNLCKHGSTCKNEPSNYTCTCQYGFSGPYCEHKAVDGGYSDWSDWTHCSRTCGGGQMTRSRLCNSPSPEPEGLPCKGIDIETESCNNDKCPECKRLHRSYGTVISCNETDSMQHCYVTCRPGMFASHPLLPVYECGLKTGYKWNHQTEENPRARLPACSQARPPSTVSLSLDGQYSSVSCTKENSESVISSLQNKMTTLDCVKVGSCHAEISTKECNETSKRKRSTSGSIMTVTINLKSDMETGGESHFDIANIAANKSAPSKGLVDFLKQTLSLEKSAQQIFNNSVDFFQVTVDGKQESVSPGKAGVSVTPSIRCPIGTIRLNVFCAECPVGSFCDGVKVYLCPVGQYQDEFGKGMCKPCPRGKTTTGTGAVDIQECEAIESHITDGDETNATEEEYGDDPTTGVKVAIGVCVSIALLVLAIAAIVFVYKYIRKRKVEDSMKGSDLYPDVREMSSRPVYAKYPY